MTTAVATAPISFQYVEEQDAFLALFPHRYDYLWADFASSSASSVSEERYLKPQWKTERRYPLSDRMIQSGASLYGVRFGRETRYCLLDIDIGSRFHPRQEPFALTPILETLENLGLIAHIVCTSSKSGGIHLYFPLDQPYPSWLVGLAVTQALKDADIWVTPGQVEVFPNARTAELSRDAHPSLFNGHRLPLQESSYLLDSDLQPLGRDRHSFVSQWQFCAAQNQLNAQKLRKTAYRQRYTKSLYSQRVKKFFNDLNVEIEAGWTGSGQTNRLLGRIAMRSYIFHHAIYGGKPLEGQELIDDIVAVARSLPGYQEWCQHQHEIIDRATEWARAVEKSHYFHYGDRHGDRPSKSQHSEKAIQNLAQPDGAESLTTSENWNSRQASKTQTKIREAVQQLQKEGELPSCVTPRFKTLVNQGIGGASLYKYKELWHPDYLVVDLPYLSQKQEFSERKVEKEPPTLRTQNIGRSAPKAIDLAQTEFGGSSKPLTSLFVYSDCNPFQGGGFEDLKWLGLASNSLFLSLTQQPQNSSDSSYLFQETILDELLGSDHGESETREFFRPLSSASLGEELLDSDRLCRGRSPPSG